MHWKIKALIQKLLAPSAIGDQLNHLPAQLGKNYHKNVVTYQTYETIRKFNYANLNLSTAKTALEIGTGYSLISPIILSLIGFRKIITTDITKDAKIGHFKKQISYISSTQILSSIIENSIYSKDEILNKIDKLRQCKSIAQATSLLNIKYLAPYSFNDTLIANSPIDYICSQVVLEHMSPQSLNELFRFTEDKLTGNNYCVHTINFIDHFTNPGFLADKTISAFNFLKYSNRKWKFWADNRIAYTNRLSHIYYYELCEKYNLEIIDFIGENYKESIKLKPEEIHRDILNKYASNPDPVDLMKFQRGTFVIRKNSP